MAYSTRCHCRQIRASTKLPPLPSWPSPPPHCHHRAAATYAITAPLSPRRHRRRHRHTAGRRLRCHHHRCPFYRRHFHRRCRCCFLLIVDCVCPFHRCRRRCLHCHRGGARWQDGGGGDCCGHARWRHAVDALPTPATAAALPASCRCHHRCRTSHRGASANDATLPAAGVFIATAVARGGSTEVVAADTVMAR